MAVLRDAHVIHCDLKPENVLIKDCETGVRRVRCDLVAGRQMPHLYSLSLYVAAAAAAAAQGKSNAALAVAPASDAHKELWGCPASLY
jgi:hypothetical protein